jgi:hypothetical protein
MTNDIRLNFRNQDLYDVVSCAFDSCQDESECTQQDYWTGLLTRYLKYALKVGRS